MTQTSKTILGGIGVLILILALVAVANRNTANNLKQNEQQGNNAQSTSTPEFPAGDNATTTPGAPTTPTGAQSSCVNAGGTWDPANRECLGVNESTCKALKGDWDGCASPCRNDPGAEVCIQMCAEVCTIR